MRPQHLNGARFDNGDLGGGGAGLRSVGLDLFDDIHAINDFACAPETGELATAIHDPGKWAYQRQRERRQATT